MFPIADPASIECKICGGPSPLTGVVDFNKSCVTFERGKLRLSGIPIYYRRCQECQFLFTNAFDDWSHDAFARHIYNAEYGRFDPDYECVRPEANARLFARLLASARPGIRVLDYGGGNGRFAELLRERDYAASSFDPFTKDNNRPGAQFDVITCFEVFEHSVDPQATLADISSLLTRGGIILCSTMLQPADFDRHGLNWWYVGPRNGHISIHSAASLKKLFETGGFRLVAHDDAGMHIAYTSVPHFLAS